MRYHYSKIYWTFGLILKEAGMTEKRNGNCPSPHGTKMSIFAENLFCSLSRLFFFAKHLHSTGEKR